VIEFNNVSLCLNDRLVLNNLSFKMDPGKSVLLVGSSGAGKSTILRLILRLIKPTSGKIIIMGKNTSDISEDEMNKIRQKFGLVFQDNALFDSLSVEENVGFFLIENLHLPYEEVHRRVIEIVTFFGLEKFLDYYPSELSGGMKKRVAIARAIVTHPVILLYDEPTAGLDPLSAKKVVDLIKNLRENFDVTSLIVTHEIHHFVGSIDRLLMLKNATIAYDGAPDISILDHFEEIEAQNNCKPGEETYGNL